MVTRIAACIVLLLTVLFSSVSVSAQSSDLSQDDIEDAQFYLGQVSAMTSVMSASLTKSSDLIANMDMTNPVWSADVVTVYGVYEVLETVHSGIVPPPFLDEAHRLLGLSFSTVADVAPLCRAAFMTMQASVIDLCSEAQQLSTTYVQQATEEINRIKEEIEG